MKERKTLVLSKAAVSETGEFTGLAAAFDNVDDGGDVIEKGFFAPVIDSFLTEGFISWSHDWGNPIAMPTKAEEVDEGLMISAQFHSTAVAQEKRTIAAERLEAGKTMGLSIGYEANQVEERDDGARRLITAKRLFETGLVMVGMNRLALMTGVKGLPYADEADELIYEVRSLVDRSRHVARQRKEGRVLSAGNRSRLESLSSALADAISDIRDLLASTDEDAGKSAMLTEVEIAYLETQAALDGNLVLN